jgi:hypothetical protein
MKSFVAACLAIAVLAAGAAIALNHYQKPVERAYATESVRI